MTAPAAHPAAHPAPLRGLATFVAVGDGPETLARIREPGTAAAIWRRTPPRGLLDWLAALPPARLPRLRASLAPRAAETAIRAALDAAETPKGPEAAFLAADCAALARRFAAIMGASALRIRFDVIEDDACRRFHLDQVPARLLLTLRGRGTEYGLLPAEGDPDPVFRVPAFAPAIFRGARWAGAGEEATGIVHRSPPIRARETRLLFVADPA